MIISIFFTNIFTKKYFFSIFGFLFRRFETFSNLHRMGKSWTHFLAEEIGQFLRLHLHVRFPLRFRTLQLTFAPEKDSVFENWSPVRFEEKTS
jgi:hypothetical protein